MYLKIRRSFALNTVKNRKFPEKIPTDVGTRKSYEIVSNVIYSSALASEKDRRFFCRSKFSRSKKPLYDCRDGELGFPSREE